MSITTLEFGQISPQQADLEPLELLKTGKYVCLYDIYNIALFLLSWLLGEWLWDGSVIICGYDEFNENS